MTKNLKLLVAGLFVAGATFVAGNIINTGSASAAGNVTYRVQMFPDDVTVDYDNNTVVATDLAQRAVYTRYLMNSTGGAVEGDDPLGSIEVIIDCADDAYDQTFEMTFSNGIQSFTYPADQAVDCEIKQNLTAEQAKYFEFVSKGDTNTPDDGQVVASADGTLDTHQSMFYIVNKATIPETVPIYIEARTDSEDDDVGPFDVVVTCNGSSETYTLMTGERATVNLPGDDTINCLVTNGMAESEYWKLMADGKHDDYENDNGRVLAYWLGAKAAGSTLWAEFEYDGPEYVTINVEKEFKNDQEDETDGTYELIVVCANGDEHTFNLKNGESGSFEYIASEKIDCEIDEILTEEQEKYVEMTRKGDSFGPDNGRMLANKAAAVADKRFYVVNNLKDTDGDGSSDFAEDKAGSDPKNKDSNPDDIDGDGFTNEEEKAAGTDPNDPNSYPGGPQVLGVSTSDDDSLENTGASLYLSLVASLFILASTAALAKKQN